MLLAGAVLLAVLLACGSSRAMLASASCSCLVTCSKAFYMKRFSEHHAPTNGVGDVRCMQAKPEDTLDLCRLLNDDLAATVGRHRRRFVGLGTVPLQAPQLAVDELRRCRHELGKYTTNI